MISVKEIVAGDIVPDVFLKNGKAFKFGTLRIEIAPISFLSP